VVGSLAYCFTDTQWFSAVEGEVYSMSSMVTALVFWCILRWEEVADRPHSLRWLVLIAYLMGLSVGIHLLNLLCIPAIVFVYYFRTAPKVTAWGVVKALLAAGALVLAMNNVIIPYTIKIGAGFDKMFVNSLSLPVNSGLIFWAFLLFALCGLGIWITHKRGKVAANTIVLCVTFALLGYSSYASTIIRAAADPPMNSNDPSNAYTLAAMIQREQYGSGAPILYGPYYSSPMDGNTFSKVTTLGADGKYHTRERATGVTHPDGFEYLFPRLWDYSKEDRYKSWMNIEGRTEVWDGQRVTVPTMGENLGFFFSYQLNHMYWRYFMWNFVGRQNDRQGYGDPLDGNWLSGINFIDQAYLGPQTDLPEHMAKDKSRNTYFFLPFILGLMGLIYQLGRDKRNFTVVMMLFLVTGIALVVYFNTAPGEPRERDYVFAGSFYAFCIWLGLGVMAVRDQFVKWAKRDAAGVAVAAVAVCASVPLLLACQNWDDHDRSHRYVMRDLGSNYLSTTLPNSIVMDNGDNDTFPLWYEQEVEGVRTDVRVMNMSYIAAPWYIEQMTHVYNDSQPVPLSLPKKKYADGVNERVLVYELTEEAVSLRELIDFIASDNKETQIPLVDGERVDFIPATTVYLPVNKENAVRSGIVRPEDAHLMVDTIPLRIAQDRYDKSDLVLLDLLATFDWNRPLYFTFTQKLHEFGLLDYLQYDGYCHRLVPIRTPVKNGVTGRIDTEYLWHNYMEVFRFGNVKDPRVYPGYFSAYFLDASDSRDGFVRLAEALLEEGDTVRAVAALDRGMEELPFEQIPCNYKSLAVMKAYYDAGETEKANALVEDYSLQTREDILYFLRFRGIQAQRIRRTLNDRLTTLEDLYRLARYYKQAHLLEPMGRVLELFMEPEPEPTPAPEPTPEPTPEQGEE
jgi:hypothetical protein